MTEHIGSESVNFNYMEHAWVVSFSDVLLGNSVVIPQLCEPSLSNDMCSMERMSDNLRYGGLMQCSAIKDAKQPITKGDGEDPWQHSILKEESSTDTVLCSDKTLAEKQVAYARTHQWPYLRLPLALHIPFDESKLAQFAIQNVNGDVTSYTLTARLLMVTWVEGGSGSGVVSVVPKLLTLELHSPAELSARVEFQNVCTMHAIETPSNAILVVQTDTLGVERCVARCAWPYLRVPWNAAVVLAGASAAAPAPTGSPTQTGPSNSAGACVPMPAQFVSVRFDVGLRIGSASAAGTGALLSREALDGVDEMASALRVEFAGSGNFSDPIVVCRVPESVTSGNEFDFVLQRVASKRDQQGYAFEERGDTHVALEGLAAQCLLMSSLGAAERAHPEAEDMAAAALRGFDAWRSTSPTLHGELQVGDADVRRVSRYAETTIHVPPRVAVAWQRAGILTVELVLVLNALMVWGARA